MWFKFPAGTTAITVEQQPFTPEHTDIAGNNFFRAPNHFAPIIQGIPGFSAQEPEAADIPDLPPADPSRDGALAQQSAEIESMKLEIRGLREDLNIERGAARAVIQERDQLRIQITTLELKVQELTPDPSLDDPLEVTGAKAKAGAKAA